MKKDYQLFRRATPVWFRLVFATVLALALMMVDGQDRRLKVVRGAVKTFVSPIQSGLQSTKQWVSDSFFYVYNIEKLATENQSLKVAEQSQAARIAQLAQLETDNALLREQLGLKQSTSTPSIAAEVLYQVVDPYARKLVLNKGSSDGVQLGQPVVTADGLIGQITDVTSVSSELTLVLDTKINVPVQIKRMVEPATSAVISSVTPVDVSASATNSQTGAATDPSSPQTSDNVQKPAMKQDSGLVRGLISGDKREGYLALRFFVPQVDIREGDLLVTSGLDGLYPAGLAVGRVASVEKSGDDERSNITVVPTTKGMAARFVLILQVADASARKDYADAQSAKAQDTAVPTTLGERRRTETLGNK